MANLVTSHRLPVITMAPRGLFVPASPAKDVAILWDSLGHQDCCFVVYHRLVNEWRRVFNINGWSIDVQGRVPIRYARTPFSFP